MSWPTKAVCHWQGQRFERDDSACAVSQHTPILGPVTGDEHRLGLVECCGEIGERVITVSVDPVGVLEDEHHRIGTRADDLRHQVDQPAPSAVGRDTR